MISHDHAFERSGDDTIMTDRFEFESPAGILGVLVNKLILEKYMRNLLIKRNAVIKEIAEGNAWKAIL